MNPYELTPDEPLSPELVLVLPPELRVSAVARLGPAAWPPVPRPWLTDNTVSVEADLARTLGAFLVARLALLGGIFVTMTLLTIVLAHIAGALR